MTTVMLIVCAIAQAIVTASGIWAAGAYWGTSRKWMNLSAGMAGLGAIGFVICLGLVILGSDMDPRMAAGLAFTWVLFAALWCAFLIPFMSQGSHGGRRN